MSFWVSFLVLLSEHFGRHRLRYGSGRVILAAILDTEWDRRGSPLELVAKVGPTARNTFYDSVGQREELDRRFVDVESLLIEGLRGQPFRVRVGVRVR